MPVNRDEVGKFRRILLAGIERQFDEPVDLLLIKELHQMVCWVVLETVEDDIPLTIRIERIGHRIERFTNFIDSS